MIPLDDLIRAAVTERLGACERDDGWCPVHDSPMSSQAGLCMKFVDCEDAAEAACLALLTLVAS